MDRRVVVLGGLFLTLFAPAVVAADEVINGTRVVTIEGITYVSTRNIIVKDQAKLILRGASLEMDPLSDWALSMTVEDDAQLVMEDANITATKDVVFSLAGRASLDMSRSRINLAYTVLNTLGSVNLSDSEIRTIMSLRTGLLSMSGSLAGGSFCIWATKAEISNSRITGLAGLIVDGDLKVSVNSEIEGTFSIKATNVEVSSSKMDGLVTWIALDSFRSPSNQPEGLAFDGQFLWNADSGSCRIYKIDPATGTVIGSFKSPGGGPRGLAFDGQYLWNVDFPAHRIYKIDPATGTVLGSVVESPYSVRSGLAFDGRYLWNADLTYEPMMGTIYKIDPATGTAISSFESPAGNPRGLAFDGQFLWNADSGSDRIYRILPRSILATRLSISRSQLSGFGIHMEADDINIADSSIVGPTTFHGKAGLVSTVVNGAHSPVQKAFSVEPDSRVQVSWYIDATVGDESGYSLKNADVDVRTVSTDELVTSGRTGSDGKVRLTVLAETVTAELAQFVGNYKVLARYIQSGKEYLSEPKGIALKQNEVMTITVPLRTAIPESVLVVVVLLCMVGLRKIRRNEGPTIQAP